MRSIALGLALLAWPIGAGLCAQEAESDPFRPILVIAHAGTAADSSLVTDNELRRIFMLRRRFWSDGQPIAPVNLTADDPLRQRFSRRVLGESPRQMAAYWNDLYFHGVSPPPVVESQRAVQLWVARTPGAIGYVDEEAFDPAVAGIVVLGQIL